MAKNLKFLEALDDEISDYEDLNPQEALNLVENLSEQLQSIIPQDHNSPKNKKRKLNQSDDSMNPKKKNEERKKTQIYSIE